MSTRTKTKVALPSENGQPSWDIQQQIQHAVDGGLADLSLRQVLGMLLSSVGFAERAAYLSQHDEDKGNGAYSRPSLGIGSMTVPVQVPRTRRSKFRPSILPPPHARGFGGETQAVLLGLLASCRSVNAAKASLKKLGVSASDTELETVANEFVQEIELRNTGPIDPDLLALFVDGKYVEVKDGDRLRPATIYIAVGIGRDGKKRILACLTCYRREHLDDWKKVLRSLIERGLRRVMVVVHDDFSGLLPISGGLFPGADIQLCIVHMERNAKKHLSKSDAAAFIQRIKAIKASWSPDLAAGQFDELCDDFEKAAPHFIKGLRKKRQHYLVFLNYPDEVRKTLSTTNLVEAVNNQLERMRRNNGGYFHSEHVLKLKLGITITYLENGTWRKVASAIGSSLHQLNAMFEAKFESE
jgi:transposase-like protein